MKDKPVEVNTTRELGGGYTEHLNIISRCDTETSGMLLERIA